MVYSLPACFFISSFHLIADLVDPTHIIAACAVHLYICPIPFNFLFCGWGVFYLYSLLDYEVPYLVLKCNSQYFLLGECLCFWVLHNGTKKALNLKHNKKHLLGGFKPDIYTTLLEKYPTLFLQILGFQLSAPA